MMPATYSLQPSHYDLMGSQMGAPRRGQSRCVGRLATSMFAIAVAPHGERRSTWRRSVYWVRSEGDTWDITTSVGSTALCVATARALEAQKPDPLVVDPYAEVFCRAVGGPAADVLDGKVPEHRLTTPDWGAHFVNFQGARTRFFADYARQAANAGGRQVVILGAGLDSRAYRLTWPGQTTIFELDRPQVLDFK